jgi:hypothetical protein
MLPVGTAQWITIRQTRVYPLCFSLLFQRIWYVRPSSVEFVMGSFGIRLAYGQTTSHKLRRPRSSGTELASVEVVPIWLVACVRNHENSLYEALRATLNYPGTNQMIGLLFSIISMCVSQNKL